MSILLQHATHILNAPTFLPSESLTTITLYVNTTIFKRHVNARLDANYQPRNSIQTGKSSKTQKDIDLTSDSNLFCYSELWRHLGRSRRQRQQRRGCGNDSALLSRHILSSSPCPGYRTRFRISNDEPDATAISLFRSERGVMARRSASDVPQEPCCFMCCGDGL